MPTSNSPQDPFDFEIPEGIESVDSCPISELIGQRMSEMSDEQLDRHLKALRVSSESPQTLKKNLLRKGAPLKPNSKRVDISILGV